MASLTEFICSQNANARVTFSESQVLNEQLLQTLAEYISSISVLMFMNLNVHETHISSGSLLLSLLISTRTPRVFTVAVQRTETENIH